MSIPNDPDYDSVINAFSRIWRRHEKLGFENLTEPEKVIFCTWQFVCEVNNGGFHQYFSNPSGEFAAENVAALEKVEMIHAASLLRRALAAFPDNTPAKDHELRYEQLRSMPDSVQRELFDELTAAFFASTEDPYALQADYIARNRNEFIGSLAK